MNYLSQDVDVSLNLQMQKTINDCKHQKQIKTENNRNNCYTCGQYIPKNPSITVLKSKKMNFQCFMDMQENYNAMFKKKLEQMPFLKEEHPYYKQREQLIEYITEIGSKLKFQQTIVHLAVFYLDYTILKSNILPNQYFMYAATCVMLAGKANELDEKIPFISKLRKYSSSQYKSEDIKKAERQILKIFNWNLQVSTNVDVLEYYLAQGIVFSDDKIKLTVLKELSSIDNTTNLLKSIENQFEKQKISDNSQQLNKHEKQSNEQNEFKPLSSFDQYELYEIVGKIEKESVRLANYIIREPIFMQSDKKLLGAASIAFLRKICGFQKYWNADLSVISGLQESDFKEIQDKIQDLIEKYFINSSSINKFRSAKSVFYSENENFIHQKITMTSQQNNAYNLRQNNFMSSYVKPNTNNSNNAGGATTSNYMKNVGLKNYNLNSNNNQNNNQNFSSQLQQLGGGLPHYNGYHKMASNIIDYSTGSISSTSTAAPSQDQYKKKAILGFP